MKKNIVFCGFGNLGKACMVALLDKGYTIKYVMTHKENEMNSVDAFSHNFGIEYSYLDARKNLEKMSEKIRTIKPDFIVSVNYRYILPVEIYDIADYAINIHGSLLPKYRGRTPHVWSIINGEKESGITCHLIEKTVDTGEIISQIVIPIGKDDTGYSLLKKYEEYYPDILVNSIEKLLKGDDLVKQDENNASYYGKRTPDMGYIDFRKKSNEIIDFVRAQSEPYPGAYYYLIDGSKIMINKIITNEFVDLDIPIGVIRKIDNQYFIRCEDKLLKIEEYKIVSWTED